MTKKLFFSMAIGAILLGSCSSDEPMGVNTGGNVTFKATLPQEIMTRSIYDDGLTATKLQYAVYDQNGTNIANLNGTGTFMDRETSINLNLVTGKTYTVVFWASAEGSPYVFDATTGKMTVTTTGNAQDKTRDAFYAAETFVVTGAINKTVTLKRPFAQINIGTSDLEDFTNAGGNISKSGITVTAPNVLNLMDGTVEGEQEYVLSPADHVSADIEFPVTTTPAQRFLTTNYILVDREKSTLDVTWTSDNDTPGRDKVVYTFIPVKRNYRTNIYGALLTNPAHYEVRIDEAFDNSDDEFNQNQDVELPEIAPGVYYNEAAKIYKVTTADGFKWFADNKVLDKRETFTLGANIDFEGEVVNPIKTAWASNAVIDGKGFTIKNIKFSGNTAALFQGITTGGSSNSGTGWVGNIKNLKVDGITGDVSARFCGLVGNLYGNMENVHVKNVKINSGEGRIGALVGIHNSGVLTNCSIENVEINGWWSVGGMIGGINETKNRTYKNLSVKNVSVSSTYDNGYHSRTLGVLVGDINGAPDGNSLNIAFENCTITDCDTNLPQYYIQNSFMWNGEMLEEQNYD
ncbi:MAG: hypothetical protein K2M87_05690 [Muribaculaceae bacterium]|nr:hypothetical protein [Muribaculaceae bacterium]